MRFFKRDSDDFYYYVGFGLDFVADIIKAIIAILSLLFLGLCWIFLPKIYNYEFNFEWLEFEWLELYVSTANWIQLLLVACALLIKVVCILISVAYFTIAERKVMASIQRRCGPDVVGPYGLLQPLADGFKLIIKEMVIPSRANPLIFLGAPIMILTLSLIGWSIIPFGFLFFTDADIDLFFFFNEMLPVSNIKCGLLFLLAVSSLNVYGIIIAGWASNSKYAFLGALRSAAQMISYEVSISLTILPVILLAGSLNLSDIVYIQKVTTWFIFPLLPCTIIFFISMLAETNRAPFDLPEAEAELVAGYNVEYSSIIFAMFFLGEYSNMLLMSALITILFFGGWLSPLSILEVLEGPFIFSIKLAVFSFTFILVRAAFPRYRYDQLMNIGWKIFLPISTGFLLFLAAILLSTNSCIVVDPLLQ